MPEDQEAKFKPQDPRYAGLNADQAQVVEAVERPLIDLAKEQLGDRPTPEQLEAGRYLQDAITRVSMAALHRQEGSDPRTQQLVDEGMKMCELPNSLTGPIHRDNPRELADYIIEQYGHLAERKIREIITKLNGKPYEVLPAINRLGVYLQNGVDRAIESRSRNIDPAQLLIALREINKPDEEIKYVLDSFGQVSLQMGSAWKALAIFEVQNDMGGLSALTIEQLQAISEARNLEPHIRQGADVRHHFDEEMRKRGYSYDEANKSYSAPRPILEDDDQK